MDSRHSITIWPCMTFIAAKFNDALTMDEDVVAVVATAGCVRRAPFAFFHVLLPIVEIICNYLHVVDIKLGVK